MVASAARRQALTEAILTAQPTTIFGPDGGSYDFHVFPFGERGDYIPANLLDEIVSGLAELARANFLTADLIVCPEPGGHTWGITLAHLLGCSLVILRDGSGSSPGRNAIRRRGAYMDSSLARPDIPANAKVVLVDDVISSGGTFAAMLSDLAEEECKLLGGLVILAKGEKGISRIRDIASVPIVPLATLTDDWTVRLTTPWRTR